MPAGTLRHALFRAFWDETASLLDIEDAFARVTARRQAVEPLRKFFASWSRPTTRRPAFPDWPIA